MKLGEYIKQYRTEHGLSQRQFAAACGLSYGYISMLEKGMNTSTGAQIVPTLQTMRSLAKGMGTTIHKIAEEVEDLYMDLTGDDKMFPLFEDLLIHSEKTQPSVTEGLSDLAIQIARLVDRLPPESRQLLLVQVRALAQAIPNPDDPAGSA